MCIEQAVIIAGGYGTRLKPFTDTAPKPMYPINGKPFIGFLVEQIKQFGIRDILILLGYLPEQIQDYLGDGSRYGVRIAYDITPVECETGMRMRSAYDKMKSTFLFLYCDNYCPINYERLLNDFRMHQSKVQITAYANRDQYTKDNLMLDADGKVLLYDKKRVTQNLKTVDIGYAIMERSIVRLLPNENVNFEATVYPQLVQNGELYATVCEHRYYSIGSWERMELTKEFFMDRKFVFMDRDGTLNKRPPKASYVETVDDFIWLDGAKEAVYALNEAGYLVFLVSNQPGIARGNLTWQRLNEIHKKMQDDLSEIGGRIDDIYVCPHNWDEGCFCRKPNPGLLYQAQREHSLNLTRGVLFGDDERDILAAASAGVKGIMVSEEYPLEKAVHDFLESERQK